MQDTKNTFDFRIGIDKLTQPQVISAFDLLGPGEAVKLLSNEEPRWLRSHLQLSRKGRFKWLASRDDTAGCWVVLIEKVV